MEPHQDKFENMTKLIFEKFIDSSRLEVDSNIMIIDTIINNFN